jgi:hypothetical protein
VKSMWRIRVIAVVIIGVSIEAAMVVAGMGPRVLIIAALVLVVSLTLYLALDLGDVVALAEWPSTVQTPRTHDGVEWRVGTLRMLLNERRRDGANARLNDLLVALIDDHLEAEHGVDRRRDPGRASAIIGPELAAFVTQPPSTRSQPAQIARIVTLIEEL